MSILQRTLWATRLRMGGNTLKKLAYLRRLQTLDRAQVQEQHEQRLRALLAHAYHHVPYYRQLFDAHDLVGPEDEVCLARFSTLPLLTKEELRERSQVLRSTDLSERSWRENTSGGSTGEPARFIQDQTYKEWSVAAKILFDEWTGYDLGDRKLVLWGSERDLLVGRETLKTYLSRYMQNEVMLNAYCMSPEQMREYVRTINAFKPKQIRAYVESIYELAQFIEREGLEVHAPDAVMTSAGTLDRTIREKVETVFGAPAFNRYGSREVGDIACENAQHDGLYVSPNHFVEILDEQGLPAKPGEVGEIVVTLLTNFAMPLIRYRIGDMGAWAEADGADGLAWPKLREVTGRVTDMFVTAEGSRVYGAYFRHVLFFRDWVEKFQVVQEDFSHIAIKIVPRDLSVTHTLKADELDEIRQDIRAVMGECKIDFEFVEAIPATASGKYRYTLSKVTAEPTPELEAVV